MCAASTFLCASSLTISVVQAEVFLSSSNVPRSVTQIDPPIAPPDTSPQTEAPLELRLASLLGEEGMDLRAEDGVRDTAPEGLVRYDVEWVDALPTATGGDEWYCMAEALYFEARGESIKGQFAVAEVVLNRVDTARFPDTVCGVVNQGTGKRYQCQFTYTCDGYAENVHEPKAWDRVGKIARLMLDGAPRALTAGATHYHTKAVNPRWSRVYARTTTIGVHHFYRSPSS